MVKMATTVEDSDGVDDSEDVEASAKSTEDSGDVADNTPKQEDDNGVAKRNSGTGHSFVYGSVVVRLGTIHFPFSSVGSRRAIARLDGSSCAYQLVFLQACTNCDYSEAAKFDEEKHETNGCFTTCMRFVCRPDMTP